MVDTAQAKDRWQSTILNAERLLPLAEKALSTLSAGKVLESRTVAATHRAAAVRCVAKTLGSTQEGRLSVGVRLYQSDVVFAPPLQAAAAVNFEEALSLADVRYYSLHGIETALDRDAWRRVYSLRFAEQLLRRDDLIFRYLVLAHPLTFSKNEWLSIRDASRLGGALTQLEWQYDVVEELARAREIILIGFHRLFQGRELLRFLDTVLHNEVALGGLKSPSNVFGNDYVLLNNRDPGVEDELPHSGPTSRSGIDRARAFPEVIRPGPSALFAPTDKEDESRGSAFVKNLGGQYVRYEFGALGEVEIGAGRTIGLQVERAIRDVSAFFACQIDGSTGIPRAFALNDVREPAR